MYQSLHSLVEFVSVKSNSLLQNVGLSVTIYNLMPRVQRDTAWYIVRVEKQLLF